MTIWLVDDDEDDCMVFGDVLSEVDRHTKLICIPDGAHLKDRLCHTDVLPDLIFLDINMPLKGGMECLAELKSDARFSTLPVIIWSTAGTPLMARQAYELGARLFVRKPSGFGKLMEVIAAILVLDLGNTVDYSQFYINER